MKNDFLCKKVEETINGKLNLSDFFNEKPVNDKEKFYLNTIKRLLKAYRLYISNPNLYKNDYILALRDYLIVFNTEIEIKEDEFLKDNEYGIVFDAFQHKYFVSYDLPDGVNEKFVKDAFIKDVDVREEIDNSRLITDAKIYHLTGYSYFKSIDQKLAVYGALNTPEGFTNLISLPTGGGKSLVTQTIAYQNEGLTIVIVPTVSLAIDQERVSKKVIKRENNDKEIFSYSSGVNLSPILKSIEDKSVRLLFISPEALLENKQISEAIKKANRNRFLKNIVIDEAHIVVDWGAGFRVDYQCLESWRNMLQMTNPSLRTILLSATFEDKAVDTLKNFFEVDGKWIEIRCDALRHEPRYNVLRTKDLYHKQKKIIDLVRKLPHPMIVYVARPADAECYKKLLNDVGINNVFTFTGLTTRNQRKKLIDEWVEDEFEIMIATSAFGVGVDKSDVRTVIHTYIPQNANTYYQELGRGGRDKLPCLSIMCLQPEDTTIGRERITKKVLTPEKIIGRWDSLYNNLRSVRLANNRILVDTSIKPNYAGNDEFDDSPTSDADMNWNIYVILFMRRFNLIKILEVTIDNGVFKILIEIIDDRLRSIDELLEAYIQKIREEEWNNYSDSYYALANAVKNNLRECISELFFETYSKVYDYCAGCNSHSNPHIGDFAAFPLKNRVTKPLRVITEEQKIAFGSTSEMVIITSDTEKWSLLDRLTQKGLSVCVVHDDFKEHKNILNMNSDRDLLVLELENLHKLCAKNNHYFTSGIVAIIYPNEENLVSDQLAIINSTIVGNVNTKVIHIVNKNYYIKEAGKTFTELVDGPHLLANTAFI